jgi:hypothetical protein
MEIKGSVELAEKSYMDAKKGVISILWDDDFSFSVTL